VSLSRIGGIPHTIFFFFSLVCLSVKATLLQKCYLDLDANFKNYNRAILQPVTNMHRPRDVKNMFVELTSLSDALKQANWSAQELEIFLASYTQAGAELDVLRQVYFYCFTPSMCIF
jgi:hypothetical protein